MVWLPDGETFLMICLFVLTEFTNLTDRHTHKQTDRQTPHDDIGRACIASRGKKCAAYNSTYLFTCCTLATGDGRPLTCMWVHCPL